MKKIIKPILLLLVLGILGYKSVYFKKLDEVKSKGKQKFDAASFAAKLWNEKMSSRLDSAVLLENLAKAISTEPAAAFESYTNALAIGNYRYAIIKFNGEVQDITEDEIIVNVPMQDSVLKIKMATEFIYGNALRDASKLIEIKDFPNTTDLDAVSAELNKILKSQVAIPFLNTVKKGDKILATGAIEINKAHINWKEIELIPARLQIVN